MTTTLLARARSTPNRGRTHLFLGDPHSDACDKTTVEPGNACSPGVWTCGVALWIDSGMGWTCADLQPEEAVAWSFIDQPGAAPVVESRWNVDGIAIVHRLCHLGGDGAEGLDAAEVRIAGQDGRSLRLAVVVTARGPAGGRLRSLTWDAATSTFTADGARIVIEGGALGQVDDADGSPAGAADVMFTTSGVLRYRIHHRFAGRLWDGTVPRSGRHDAMDAASAFAAVAAAWNQALPARIFAPDPRVALAWERCSWHLLAAMEGGLPRIGAVNYPVFWLRDGILILRALDLIGRHDLARIGCDWLAPVEFSGGFGAEGDAPGEGVYALVAHARMTQDPVWLAGQWPFIRRRIRTYERMITTEAPLRAYTDNRLPWLLNAPGGSVLCLAAQHGLAHARMDHHCPDFFINCWGQAALALGAEAARAAGESAEAERLSTLAGAIDRRIATHLLPAYGNDRDPIIAPWPSGALSGHREELTRRFGDWFRSHRLDTQGRRHGEPLWTYFEAAQAHNAILLGLVDEGWTCLQGMIDAPAGPWDVGSYGEGRPSGPEFLPFGNHHPGPPGSEAVGWLDPQHATHGNMPHNWTSAEVIAALRDCFVQERDGRLVLGAGAPRAWRVPGARYGAERMPTELGPVSFTIAIGSDGSPSLASYAGPADPILA